MRIADIEIGDRRREDMGDIEGLAASIRRYGLLHPVVVDSGNRLVAGERRIRASQSLGLLEIEVRPFGELSGTERHEIELEENLRRKDLTPYERSRTLVQYVEAVKQVAKEEFRAELTRNSKGGRPVEQGSYRDIEKRTGIPQETIRHAEQHVAAAEKYPELRGIPQSNAITIAKNLDALPEDTRHDKVEALRRHDQDTLAELAGLPPVPKGPTPQEIAREDPGGKWLRTLRDIHILIDGIQSNGGIGPLANKWSAGNVALFWAEVEEIRSTLADWSEELGRRLAANGAE